MDLDLGFLDPPADTSMKLPPGVVANAPYQGATPMLPTIPVPLVVPWPRVGDEGGHGWVSPGLSTAAAAAPVPKSASSRNVPANEMTLVRARPSMLNAAVMGLSAAQLLQITGDRAQEAHQDAGSWTYEMRREAQGILPFLFLGPSNAARDRTFLERAGITKVIAIRDSRLALARLLVVEHVAKEMGIESECIDVSNLSDLLRALPAAVQSINRHMLAAPTDREGVSQGKVLVFCETGNVRSATVVAAYLMSVYGMGLVDALRFLSRRRFCMSLDEECKHMLLSFSELLHARRDVAQVHATDDLMQDDEAGHSEGAGAGGAQESVEASSIGAGIGASISTDRDAALSPPSAAPPTIQRNGENMDIRATLAVPQLHPTSFSSGRMRDGSRPAKRRIEETMDEEDDRMEGAGEDEPSREPSAEPGRLHLDMARYQDRKQFVPFTDTGPRS